MLLRREKYYYSLYGVGLGRKVFFIVLLLSFFSCTKEDLDDTIVIDEEVFETETIWVYDCNELQLNFEDTCQVYINENLSVGTVNSLCECEVDLTCNLEVIIVMHNGYGNINGFIEAIASGGEGPYTYDWLDGETVLSSGPILNNVTIGGYQLEISDSLGCTEIFNVNVETINTQWDCQAQAGDYGDECQNGGGIINIECECVEIGDCELVIQNLQITPNDDVTEGSIQFHIDGGTGPYNWTISSYNGELVQSGNISENNDIIIISDLYPGFYIYQVMDEYGCLALNFVVVP